MVVSPLLMLVLMGAVLGALALFWMLLANRKTRAFALFLLLGGGVFFLLVASYRAVQVRDATAVAENLRQQQAEAKRRVAEAAEAYERLTEPRIPLSMEAEEVERDEEGPDTLYEPAIKLQSSPPDWGTRPKEDYSSDSDYTKQRAKELGVAYVFTYASPSKIGVAGCVDLEKIRVNTALLLVAAKNARGEDQSGRVRLGMSTAELYKKFVLERIAVEKDGWTTLYTQIGVKKQGVKDLLASARWEPVNPPSGPGEALPKQRPKWVDDLTVAKARHKDATVIKLVSGPYANLAAAGLGSTGVSMTDTEEQRQLIEAARRYVRDSFPSGSREAGLAASGVLGMSANELKNRFVKDRFVERRGGSEGDAFVTPTETLHTLVVFEGRDAAALVSKTLNRNHDEQLVFVAVLFGGVLAVLAIAYAILKFDEATRGYYTKRLLIGVPVGIIGVVIVLALTAEIWDGLFL